VSAVVPHAAASTADRLGVAILFSLIVHAVVILGIGFDFLKPAPSVPTLDVTLLNASNAETPDKADFLAQAANAGGGDADRARRPGSPFNGPLPVADPGIAPAPVLPASPPQRTASGPHVLVTRAPANTRMPQQRDSRDQPQASPRPSDIPIDRQLAMARLTQEVRRQEQSYARRPRRKYISANTRQYAYAAYMQAWVNRIERVGNLNYPDAARRRRLHGQLMLTVALARDGHVEGVVVNQGSGYRVLDDAAIRIVHLAAPYPPIPRERDGSGHWVNELYITRTWEFLPNDRLETRGADSR
jgi:periplasmic protein TonB